MDSSMWPAGATRPAPTLLGTILVYCLLGTTSSPLVAAQQDSRGGAPWSSPALSHVPTPAWLGLSGEVRVRMESRSGLGYRSGVSDSYLLVRSRFNADVRPADLLRFSFQAQDARAPGMLGASTNGVMRDPFDLRQAYARVGYAQGPIALTVGRQLLVYADQRLVGALDWTNTSRAFDAAKLEVRTARFDVDVFSAAVVQNDPTRSLNRSDFDNTFHGVYGRVRTGVEGLVVEPFAFWRASSLSAATETDRYSVGVRVSGRVGGLESAVTWVEQWGESGALDIEARAVLVSTVYTLTAAWSPRIVAEYNYASGDGDPMDRKLESFDDAYPTAHLYYGYNDLVGLRNLHNVRLGARVTPLSRLVVGLDLHAFALASGLDDLYNAGGASTVAAPVGGAPDRRVGDEVDLTVDVSISPTVGFAGGVGHMFPGAFLEASSPGAGHTFTHAALVVRF